MALFRKNYTKELEKEIARANDSITLNGIINKAQEMWFNGLITDREEINIRAKAENKIFSLPIW